MLKGFNKKFFGSYLKDLRTSLGFTQREVFKITNITTETLRRIENGISLPQFRTLEDLSIAYKKDLLNVFSTMRKSNAYYNYYSNLDELIVNFSTEKLEELKLNYFDFIKNDETEIFDISELKQFSMILESLECVYKQDADLLKANEILFDAIRLTQSKFEIELLEQSHYTHIEFKCLFLIATNYGELQQNELSNTILLFVLKHNISLDDQYRDFDELTELHLKILLNISYNYHYLDNHEMVINYSLRALDVCRSNKTFYLMHCFYYRLGIANHLLNNDKRFIIDCFRKSTHILEIQNMDELAKTYHIITKEKYGLNF